MKKLTLILAGLLISSTAFASITKDCSGFTTDQMQSEAADKINSKGVKSMTIQYSSDLATQAIALQIKLKAYGIAVKMTKLDEPEKCELTDFSR